MYKNGSHFSLTTYYFNIYTISTDGTFHSSLVNMSQLINIVILSMSYGIAGGLVFQIMQIYSIFIKKIKCNIFLDNKKFPREMA